MKFIHNNKIEHQIDHNSIGYERSESDRKNYGYSENRTFEKTCLRR